MTTSGRHLPRMRGGFAWLALDCTLHTLAHMVRCLLVLAATVVLSWSPSATYADEASTNVEPDAKRPQAEIQSTSTDTDIEPPLAAIEARLGHGLALGGGAGESRLRSSALTFSAMAELAVIEQPFTSLLIGGIYEGGDRATAGVSVAARFRAMHSLVRASVGLTAILTPNTAIGPVVSAGRCRSGRIRLCIDIEATAFVFGSDVPDQSIAAQLQLVVGVGFDVQ